MERNLDNGSQPETFSTPVENQTDTGESGFLGEEPPFPVGVSEADTAAHSGEFEGRNGMTLSCSTHSAMFPPSRPVFGTTTHAQVLKPARSNDGRLDLSSNVLRQASPHPTGTGYSFQVEKENCRFVFHNEKCQEIARVSRKAALVCKSRESTAYTKYIVSEVEKLDHEICHVKHRTERQIQKLEDQIQTLELEFRQKEESLKLLKQQARKAELEADKRAEYFERYYMPRDREEVTQVYKDSSNPREVEQLGLLRIEQQNLQQKILDLESKSAIKDAKISLLQTQHFDEMAKLKEDNEKKFVLAEELNEEAQILAQSIYQIVEHCNQKHLHQQVSEKSKIYSGYLKTRTPAVAEVYFGAPHLTHCTRSVRPCVQRHRRKSFYTYLYQREGPGYNNYTPTCPVSTIIIPPNTPT